MGSGRPHPDATIADPDSVPDRALLVTSLRTLSKTLPQTTSSRSTVKIYLRWLEVHRLSESKATEHWSNTIQHWVQSLKYRGFRESEVASEVAKWKKANPDRERRTRREPPFEDEIAKAFKDEGSHTSRIRELDIIEKRTRERRHRDDGALYRSDDGAHNKRTKYDESIESVTFRSPRPLQYEKYDLPPPGNYVCNRCGKKGHYLQVCPTNLDPTYDTAPGNEYECSICGGRGKHFKSLCPRNTDPNSIIQRRRARGISTVSPPPRGSSERRKEMESLRRGRSGDRSQKSVRDRSRSETIPGSISDCSPVGLSPTRAAQAKKKLREIDEERRRLYEEESIDLLETIKNSPPTETSLKRGRGEDFYKQDVARSANSPPKSYHHRKRTRTDDDTIDQRLLRELELKSRPESGSPAHPPLTPRRGITNIGDYEISTDLTDNSDSPVESAQDFGEDVPINNKKDPFIHRSRSPASIRDPSESDPSDHSDIEAQLPSTDTAKTYHTEILSLVDRWPTMREGVNPTPRRPTALEMWVQVEILTKANRRARRAEMTQKQLPDSAESDSDKPSTPQTATAGDHPWSQCSSGGTIYFDFENAQGFDGASDEMENCKNIHRTIGTSKSVNITEKTPVEPLAYRVRPPMSKYHNMPNSSRMA